MPLPPHGVDGAPVCVRCRPGEDGAASLVLRVRSLRQTVELLRLGGAIEALPGISTLSLVRGEPGDAWFAATLPTSGRSRLEQAQALANALAAMPGYRIAALATEIGVELDVAPLAEQPQPASPPAVASEPAPAPSSAAPPVEVPALPSEGVTPEERPGGAALLSDHLMLVVAPFRSFARLNEFQAALRALSGVRAARVRRFYKGSLQLAVEYDDATPLKTRLATLPGFRFRLVAAGADRIQIEIDEASADASSAARAAG